MIVVSIQLATCNGMCTIVIAVVVELDYCARGLIQSRLRSTRKKEEELEHGRSVLDDVCWP